MTVPVAEPPVVKRPARFVSLWGPVALWAGIIFWMSGIPSLTTGWGLYDFLLRKAAHVAEYAVLAALFRRALKGSSTLSPSALFWATVVFCFVYAVSDEWHQSFVPGREPSFWDVLIDTAGALAAAAFLRRRPPPGLALLALAFFPTGCGRADLLTARHYERTGQYEKALRLYTRVADRHPRAGAAPQALYSAGRLAADNLLDYPFARRLFQDLADEHGRRGAWKEKAERALLNSPNYFPLIPGARWEEGDSDTGGRNASIRIQCEPLAGAPGSFTLARDYYAGRRQVDSLSSKKIYRKTGLELREAAGSGKAESVVLKYPLSPGATWPCAAGPCEVLGTADVQVRAGLFRDCLKVKVPLPGVTSSWKVDYYAPGIGKVLTSAATATTEKRNTELLSYNLLDGKEADYVPPGLWARLASRFNWEKK